MCPWYFSPHEHVRVLKAKRLSFGGNFAVSACEAFFFSVWPGLCWSIVLNVNNSSKCRVIEICAVNS